MVGRDQEAAPKPDGLIQSSTTSTQLASTPSMSHRWSMTDPSGRPLFADCQRSNPSMALSQVSQVTFSFLSYTLILPATGAGLSLLRAPILLAVNGMNGT